MTTEKRNVAWGIIALLVGAATGLLTIVGQKYLPGSLNSIANSGAVWLVPAFFIASAGRTKRAAIFLCVETLLACVLTYYMAESFINEHAFPTQNRYFYLWLACAVVFGAVFGLGAYFRGQKSAQHEWGANLLPAVFLSEGLSELIHLSDYAHMVPAIAGRIVIGVLLYGIISGKRVFGAKQLISLAVLSLLGLAGFELLYRLTV
jgi:magnesium-transporting ATPase (P-type)